MVFMVFTLLMRNFSYGSHQQNLLIKTIMKPFSHCHIAKSDLPNLYKIFQY